MIIDHVVDAALVEFCRGRRAELVPYKSHREQVAKR